ncbi:XRE family transcriptional regulator [Saccharopolyspora pogona]|uniref:XRE family transcriptional regulator n=1 Tax=Saccharopolyspora pogona TaxID=333966 RepID=UPI001689CBA9|nr:XRE family transcriptional regulator [Saccharopolyspora pogona]
MGNTREPVCTFEDILSWKQKINPKTGKHYNGNEIAEIYGTTRQNISYIWRKEENRPKTARERVMEHYPWKQGARFHTNWLNLKMRDHAEFMATDGKGMSEVKLQELLWFYQQLERENAVVEFDPNIPPSRPDGVGGFALRPRKPSDGDLIIRVNKYTNLTPEGMDLWIFPEEKPKIRVTE